MNYKAEIESILDEMAEDRPGRLFVSVGVASSSGNDDIAYVRDEKGEWLGRIPLDSRRFTFFEALESHAQRRGSRP
jgi:hypothetical protein